ncbi:MAG: hypothetical protein AAGJ40_06605 [Planctomycetota bacterium]
MGRFPFALHAFPTRIRRFRTNVRVVIATIGSCIALMPVLADDAVVSEPYLVFVAEDAAHLRCGPAGEYYRTDPLRHGQELEVYVETTDGWLGVRPVEASFCWVVADAVELEAPTRPRGRQTVNDLVGNGEITEDKTVAWIGTNLGRARRYRWQVQLAEGEQVTILGSSQRDGPDGPQTWYRIVPPSGEFRWIHRNQVVTTAEDLVATLRANADGNDEGETPIEFLPGGPTSIVPRPSRDDYVEDTQDNYDFLDPFDERSASKTTQRSSSGDLTSSRRRVPGDPSGEALSDAAASQPPAPKSLSRRIADGLSVLLKGRDAMPELQPVTESSRRVPDLVPIGRNASSDADLDHANGDPSVVTGSGLASAGAPAAATASDATPTVQDPLASSDDRPGVTTAQSQSPSQSPGQSPILATPPGVSTMPTSVALPQQSPMSISSTPRLVDSSVPRATTSMTNSSMVRTVANLKPLRSISAAQIEEVQRQVAAADEQSLPSLFSMMLARGASAPEIALLAEAAERTGNLPLAQRARSYQTLARQRDGDTIVRTASLDTPVIPAPRVAAPSPGPTSSPTRQGAPPTSEAPTMNGPELGQLKRSPTLENDVHPAAESVRLTGELVKVYSADPHRPPYALTDHGGRTLAYVTPSLGVEVNEMLGIEIQVEGERGYLRGLDTPHVLATKIGRVSSFR